jgi:hypothetical protein
MMVDLDHTIVGVDTVACSETRSIEWNLHTWKTIDELGLHILAPDTYEQRSGLTEVVPAYPNDGTRDTALQLSTRRRSVQWVWCLGLAEIGRPQLTRKDDALTIAGLPCGPIRFDGRWLIPEGFNETPA